MKKGSTELLLSAVMRFGKTACCYTIVNESSDINYVLVVSAKADVRPAWRDDINHINFIDNFVFIEFDGNYTLLVTEKDDRTGKLESKNVQISQYISNPKFIEYMKNKNYSEDKIKKDFGNSAIIDYYRWLGKKVIIFATLQDLAGKSENIDDKLKHSSFDNSINIINNEKPGRKIKNKHTYLFDNAPDMIIIDETHYGSHSNTYGNAVGLSKKSKQEIQDNDTLLDTEKKLIKEETKGFKEIDKKIKAIHPKYKLQCSGTPYYILASGEFSDYYKNKAIISNVSFNDMIQARDQWRYDHKDEDESNSPYFGIPDITRFGFNLTKKARQAVAKSNIDTKLSYLFANDNNKFYHEDAIIELMKSVFGTKDHEISGFLDVKRIQEGKIFKHIIMVLPHINDCHLLKDLLIKKGIIDQNERKIINAVERRTKLSVDGQKKDTEAEDSTTLNKELSNLENNKKKSLTLTVQRFLTGVSVPLWDAMLYLKDTKSPQEYDQAIFRLCTRNVNTITLNDGTTFKQCMKNNVYLVDFKIDRMYNMMINSAIAQCSAKGETSMQKVKEVINDEMQYQRAFAENIYDNKNTIDHLHPIKAEDLLKKYVQYNKNRSIEDNILGNIDSFNSFLNKTDNLKYMDIFRSDGKLSKSIGPKQSEEDDNLPEGFDDAIADQQNKKSNTNNQNQESDVAKVKEKINKEELNTLKLKLVDMLKRILYSCICMDKCPEDIDDYIKLCETNDQYKQIIKDFGIAGINVIKECIKQFSNSEILQLNSLIYQINWLLNQEDLQPIERLQNAVSKLGKIDKNEVITPESVVKKMVDKLYGDLKGQSILEVNSKYGEFLIEIYKRYGKEVANNVKIVASSEVTRNFIRKVLRLLELDEYNLIGMEDYDNNKRIDINDLLDKNGNGIKKVLESNKGMKFDVILSNPRMMEDYI